jgi:zinc transport system substrate-binding protein
MRALPALAVLLLLACGSGSGSGGPPKVAVSIFPLYDVARQVAGDRLEVVLILPPGQSEHGFDPTPRQMAAVSGSRLALLVGLGMDPWAAQIVEGAAPGATIREIGPALEPRHFTAREVGVGMEEEHGHEAHGHEAHGHEAHEHAEEGAPDPHFWLDPVRMQTAVDVMVEAFSRLDAAGAPGFRERGEAVERELAALHAEIEERAGRWSRRDIVTFHGSFGTFADRYGLRVAAVLEPFPGREPTPRYLEQVLGAVRASRAAALFSEPQLDPRPARVIAAQAGLALFELDPVGGTAGRETYAALLRHNVGVLDRALGAP